MAKSNKYKQVPVVREQAPVETKPTKPMPQFGKGDYLSTVFNPINFDLRSPCQCMELTYDPHYTSGWKVLVKEHGTERTRYFDSFYFSKHKP